MESLTVGRAVAAVPTTVWDLVTDLDGSADVIRSINRIERLDGPPGFEVGPTWRETRTVFRGAASEVMSVAELDPGVSYVVEASSRGPSTARRCASSPPAAEPFFSGATRRALEQVLADIAGAAETI